MRSYRLLLILTLLVLLSFAFDQLSWLSSPLYTLIAILLTRMLSREDRAQGWHNRLYLLLGVVVVLSQWTWLLTPLAWAFSGVPVVLFWTYFTGWSLIRLVKQLAKEHQVDGEVLMGAVAGYLLLGITAGIVMSALETIQPNSFALLDLKIHDGLGDHLNVILKYQRFAEINYYAFVCLTTLGLGDIKPLLPAAQMITVVTSIVGPMYMVVLMGVLIGRLSGHSKEITRGSSERSEFSSDK